MNNRIYFVDRRSKNEIDSLRMKAYQEASGFTLDINTLEWKSSDDDSYVMVAESGNRFISTMRGEVISDHGLLEKKLECPWHFDLELDMPILLLSRAATLSSYRSLGLNLILRYWFLRFAMTHQIRFVLGTFVAGSPREKTLAAMGYQFFENKHGWQESTYRALGPVAVVALDLIAHGEQALNYCLNRLPKGIEEYQFNDIFPELRIVRNL